MKIELKEITVKELTDGYEDSQENGVTAYGGRLNVRPAYQREFIYKPEQQQAVIRTVMKGFPLNVMYWNVCADGDFELIDGQQRTLSICEFVEGNFSVVFDGENNPQLFDSLPADKRRKIENYPLMIYQCTGTESETLDWFRTINIAGEKLTDQELRNAVYHGPFVTEAKKKFSKSTCVAKKIGEKYLSGSCIRQDYLETVISWLNQGKIDEYMLKHRFDSNADELYLFFQRVMDWVKVKFPVWRKEMKNVPWGELYQHRNAAAIDAPAAEEKIAKLMADSDVQRKNGIYSYILDDDERHLGIRAFDDNTKREIYERQKGICRLCKKHFELEQMEADHITPWCEGGRTIAKNCQMLCRECNRRKSGK